jgi:Ser/Thr protein kinase RdoA (MazF antagonist)
MTEAGQALDLDADDVARLVRSRYGLDPIAVHLLDSELSTVARLELRGCALALKAQRSTPGELLRTRWRVAAMQRLSRAGLPVARTVPDVAGQDVAVADTGAGAVLLHLTGWLDGIPLEAAPATPALLHDVGRAAAAVAAGLATHPAPPGEVAHPWELARTLPTLEAAGPLPDPALRRLVAEAAGRFRTEVEPRLPSLPRQVVHHDLHDSNLLVDPAAGRVTGVLDFGDLVVGPRVAELAVAAAYASRNAADPVAALLAVAEGWGRVLPLDEDEIAVVHPAAVARLAVNLAVWASRRDGRRGSYAQARSARSAAALAALLAAEPRGVLAALHDRLADG